MPLTNSGKRVVGKPKNASRARTAGASMPRAKLDTSRSATNAVSSETPGYKNNTVTSQSQWGGVAPTGKAAAQATVLQFSGASPQESKTPKGLAFDWPPLKRAPVVTHGIRDPKIQRDPIRAGSALHEPALGST